MKTYNFAPIAACEYPTVIILDHPHIWGGVKFCINLSEKPYSPELVTTLAYHGIEWIHCPVSEESGADWLESFAKALPQMFKAYKEDKKQIVHCDLGDNRSRSLVEALHYLLKHSIWRMNIKANSTIWRITARSGICLLWRKCKYGLQGCSCRLPGMSMIMSLWRNVWNL